MTKNEWKIAVPLLFGLALCAAGFFRGAAIGKSYEGVSAMRVYPSAQEQRVAVVVNKIMYVLDAKGHQIAQQSMAELGLKGSPNDIDITRDAQQRIEAWLFDDTVPSVVRCAWSEALLKFTECAALMSGPQLKAQSHSIAVHLAVDIMGKRIFIADAKSHLVQIFDMAGKLLVRSEGATTPLQFPNRLRYLGNDTLAVADNDNRRLVWLQVTPNQIPRLIKTVNSSNHSDARSGRGKVTDAAFGADGTVWMIAMKQGQKDGDVLVFDNQLKSVARAQLPETADPIIVEALQDGALVADYTSNNLYRINAKGRYEGEFGDSDFLKQLAPMQALGDTAKLWTTGSLMAGGLIVILGLFLGWKYGEKPKLRGQFETAEKDQISQWRSEDFEMKYPVVLEPSAAHQKSMRRQAIGILVTMIFVMVMVVGLASSMLSNGVVFDEKKFRFILIFGVTSILLIGLCYFLWCELTQHKTLRVTREKVGLFVGQRRIAVAQYKDVYASPHMLLIELKQIRLYASGGLLGFSGPIYDTDLLGRAILAKLPHANLIDDQKLTIQMLQNLPLRTKLFMYVCAGLGLVLTALQLFHSK
jgi:hypothetical protein